MKVLFLDFDGVLNSDRYARLHPSPSGVVIDPACLARLRGIIRITDAKIVLSTSWREHWSPKAAECDPIGQDINRIFAGQGLHVHGKTGVYRMGNGQRNPYIERTREITDWLTAHPDTRCYAILDDMSFQGGPLADHAVRTSGRVGGLSDDTAAQAIRLLESKAENPA